MLTAVRGSDSRRVLIVNTPDEYDEYPIFAADFDDLPCLELMYPGFDVYLAEAVGLIKRSKYGTYSELKTHPLYGPRMRTHARQLLGGKYDLTYPFD